MIFSIVGTRDPDPAQRSAAFQLADYLSSKGHTIRTGAAFGIDEAAMKGTHRGRLEIYLPWALYNSTIIPAEAKIIVYKPGQHWRWGQSVNKHHPAAGKLSRGAFALHARNYGIVFGEAGWASDYVIAFPNEKGEGGTAQAIRIAEAFKLRLTVANKGQISNADQFVDEVLTKIRSYS